MDTLGPDLLVWAFMFILVFEGAHGSIQDACKGHCVNLEGYFCEPFNGICELCQHCRTGDGNGCRTVCDAWNALKTTTTSTPGISSTTSFLAQTTMSAQMNATSMIKGISPMGGEFSNAGTSSPKEMTDNLWLWLCILVAGIVLMIAGYGCCQHLRKRRKQNNRERQDEEIALNDDVGRFEQQQVDQQEERVEAQEEPVRCEDPLLPNHDCIGHGGQETIPVSVPAKKVNNECPGKQLMSREVIGAAEALESGYKSADVYGTATVQDQGPFTSQGSTSLLSQARALRSTDQLPRALRSTDQPAVEFEHPLGALPFVNQGDGTRLSHPVQQQDGTHVGHEYAV